MGFCLPIPGISEQLSLLDRFSHIDTEGVPDHLHRPPHRAVAQEEAGVVPLARDVCHSWWSYYYGGGGDIRA